MLSPFDQFIQQGHIKSINFFQNKMFILTLLFISLFVKLFAGQIQIWTTGQIRPAEKYPYYCWMLERSSSPQSSSIDSGALISGQVEQYIEFLAVIVEPLRNPVLCLCSKQLFPQCWQTPATLEQKPFPLLIICRKAKTTM